MDQFEAIQALDSGDVSEALGFLRENGDENAVIPLTEALEKEPGNDGIRKALIGILRKDLRSGIGGGEGKGSVKRLLEVFKNKPELRGEILDIVDKACGRQKIPSGTSISGPFAIEVLKNRDKYDEEHVVQVQLITLRVIAKGDDVLLDGGGRSIINFPPGEEARIESEAMEAMKQSERDIGRLTKRLAQIRARKEKKEDSGKDRRPPSKRVG